MQDDLTWGVKALVADGTVDPKRVGIFGVSYGGYATLAGVAFTPNVYAAAVAYAAPSNLITLLDAIPPYWEAIRKQMYTRMNPFAVPGRCRAVTAGLMVLLRDVWQLSVAFDILDRYETTQCRTDRETGRPERADDACSRS
jgi:dienelactone hydrolase